ncbi:predicted protein [Histoplasma capsulatum var. duboisii H88]|uniref:Predicted protein n=1 Tax=Ajellomyces capsulatus (strain H88) TaxID=544711 RepID=F0UCW5_AJEC8|nr:predicted protein [Histoplasma capsulatum var. duboisii H88]QSS49574.1 hypothetical protein I7I53_09969 [Histoplasma capsulatum var. duboisii H88]
MFPNKMSKFRLSTLCTASQNASHVSTCVLHTRASYTHQACGDSCGLCPKALHIPINNILISRLSPFPSPVPEPRNSPASGSYASP